MTDLGAWRNEVGWALILGDLVVDVLASLSHQGPVARLASGSDVDLRGDVNLAPGGSAWLFADALFHASRMLPVICSALGGDWAGRYITQELAFRSFPTWALHRVDHAATSKVLMCSFADRQRLMIASKDPHLGYAPVFSSSLQLLKQLKAGPALAWVSGYVLAGGPAADGVELLAQLCEELRIRQSPIVLDLVPHNFIDQVGTLHDIEGVIGPVDVIVGELGTVIGLGFDGGGSAGCRLEALRDSAHLLSMGRRGAIVQVRTEAQTYTQAVAGGSLPHPIIMQQQISEHGLRGIGDRLAVSGLSRLLPIAPASQS